MTLQNRACSYQYDALDRLASRFSTERGTTRHFYCANRLVTEREGSEHRAYIHGSEQLLAWQIGVAKMISTALIAPDRSNSVLAMIAPGQNAFVAYSPYGHRANTALLPGLPGFNGEHPDPLTGHYLLGNGYRAFNPVLMRFNSPDSLSPFGEGGLNGYAYCQGDPVNRSDPSGHGFQDFLKDAVPYIALIASAAGSLVLYKFTKVRFRKWFTGNAPEGDKVVSMGAVGVIASAATTAAGSIIRIADPESPIAYPLLALGAIGAIGFQGVRYAGHKLGKPASMPVQKRASTENSLSVRRSMINRGPLGDSYTTEAAEIRGA